MFYWILKIAEKTFVAMNNYCGLGKDYEYLAICSQIPLYLTFNAQ